LWQVKSGTIFDNVIITDSVQRAEEFGNETWGKTKDPEKKMKDEQDEVERKKEEEDRKKKDAEEKTKKPADEEESDAEDAASAHAGDEL